mmetsp:Transcript_56309/g.115156  ORF Transcript_56309/g.115156 Transcript_56309/m.115156 type:complete len:487 (-) Transcript_56309:40-1500(-)
MDEHALHITDSSPNFQDKLHMLLEEAEMFVPGSNERTNSLEQIRSILLDRGTSMKRGQLGQQDASFPAGSRRQASAGSSFLHGGMSPDDGAGLEDLYYEGAGAMSSIPESSPPDNWESGGHLGQYGDGAEYDDIEGTFRMDDVGEPNMPAPAFPHVHIRSHAITSSSSHKHVVASGGSVANHGAPTTAARILGSSHAARAHTTTAAGAIGGTEVGFAAVAAGGGTGTGAASVLTGGLAGKASASQARPPVARPPTTKVSLQMSNLAREEQAAIPHVSSGDAGGAPVVPMQLEPEKRLSHKEVEQRRREKAKQYFDELRGLLPYGGDSAKFDKNAILHHSIALIKQLLTDLDQEEASAGSQRQEDENGRSIPGSAEFRCCFDVTRQPLCFAGLDSRVWEANAAFCTLLGYTRLEIGTVALLTQTAKEDAESTNQQWHHLLNSPQSSGSYLCKLLRKDSQQVSCNVDLSLIRRNGKPHLFLVAANPSL